MKGELINPGYLNQIFELSNTEPYFSNVQFVNGTVEDKGIIVLPEVECGDTYVTLKLVIKQIHMAKESSQELVVLNASFTYSILKLTEMSPNDFVLVLDNSIKRINLASTMEQKPLLNYSLLKVSTLNNSDILLTEISEKVNGCPNIP